MSSEKPADWYVPPDLHGKVAVVTGASRGAGRGIACVLGQAGATVYVTGRSTRSGETTENLPGTIEETAEAVTARGGRGIAVRCDHTVDSDVITLFDRVGSDHARLDLLVSNAWGGYEYYEFARFSLPIWEQPLRHWEGMFTAGVRTHLLAARFAIPLMLPQRSGLMVSTIAWLEGRYLGNLFYDVAKAAVVRMAFGLAHELRPHDIAAVALAPGFVRTERVLAAHAAQPFDLTPTESPEYIGRAVAALAADPQIMRRSGQTLLVGDMARDYGFTDTDGRQIPAFRIPDAS
jgi:NAD(P)-dependent dehydrogenase (short-subunit alcohol dehydrogenase family)